jgi:hypothetical protein
LGRIKFPIEKFREKAKLKNGYRDNFFWPLVSLLWFRILVIQQMDLFEKIEKIPSLLMKKYDFFEAKFGSWKNRLTNRLTVLWPKITG